MHECAHTCIHTYIYTHMCAHTHTYTAPPHTHKVSKHRKGGRCLLGSRSLSPTTRQGQGHLPMSKRQKKGMMTVLREEWVYVGPKQSTPGHPALWLLLRCRPAGGAKLSPRHQGGSWLASFLGWSRMRGLARTTAPAAAPRPQPLSGS